MKGIYKILMVMVSSMLLFAVGSVQAEQVFFDDFDNSNYISEGWTKVFGSVLESGTTVSQYGILEQDFSSSIDWDEYNWSIEFESYKELNNNHHTRLDLIDGGFGGSNSIRFFSQVPDGDVLANGGRFGIQCTGSCSCTETYVNFPYDNQSRHVIYLAEFEESSRNMTISRNGTQIIEVPISGCDLTGYEINLWHRSSSSHTDWINISADLPFVTYPPVINITSPSNNTRSNQPLDIEYLVTDTDNSTSDCDLYVNNVLNQTDNSVTNNTLSFFNVSVSNGLYSYYLNCTDGEYVVVSGTYKFNFDDGDPFILSESPNVFNTTTFSGNTMNVFGNVSNINLSNVTVNIYYPNSTLFYRNETLSFGDPTFHEWNWIFNTTTEPNGAWSMNIYAEDWIPNSDEVDISFTVANCVADYVCSGYSSCNASDVAPCNNVTDNNACGYTYTGNYSEFTPQSCNYCQYDLSFVSETVCDSVTDLKQVTYNDNNFVTCCNVTLLGSDCYFGNQSTGYVNESCSIHAYTSDDIGEATISAIATAFIFIGKIMIILMLLVVILYFTPTFRGKKK